MYSKDQGNTYGVHRPGGRIPSYRQPDRPKMQVPANYSGHAIVDGEERPLGIPQEPVTDMLSTELPIGETPTPRFDGLPRVSELGAASRRSTTVPIPAGFEESETDPVAVVSTVAPPTPRKASLFDLSHFPFGHGIGWEELLILGLILFFLHESTDCEDRGDLDETVILLGLLLLLG
ncbi:MAG: hypothetical protein IJA91_01490 [Clostridia bacterium]|nr:hypothetical protein [Clostridia bacterium]